MNRKEMIALTVLFTVSFSSGVFAAAPIQQVFVTNFPLDGEGNLRTSTAVVFPQNELSKVFDQNITIFLSNTGPFVQGPYIASVDISQFSSVYVAVGITTGPTLPVCFDPNGAAILSVEPFTFDHDPVTSLRNIDTFVNAPIRYANGFGVTLPVLTIGVEFRGPNSGYASCQGIIRMQMFVFLQR